ncbi:MAG: hypothetical protein IH986_14525 [Planctomycetes bacterium]|nr:hypothetical protein [Planctomycetota bacterium]
MSDETEMRDQDAIDAARWQVHGESGNAGTPPSGEPPATAGRSSRATT